jgi:enamine deaminase RidA (YjgF/YER057c/UK114 family)
MTRKEINPDKLPAPVGGYSQAIEIGEPSRLLFISGQIPEDVKGSVPASFDEQCELVWRNIGETLASADMSYGNLVKVTTYLTHPDQATRNSEIRRKYLGDLHPSLTVVVVATLESKWLLEIEAIAAM